MPTYKTGEQNKKEGPQHQILRFLLSYLSIFILELHHRGIRYEQILSELQDLFDHTARRL